MVDDRRKKLRIMPFKAQILFALALMCFVFPLWMQHYQGISGSILLSTPIMKGDDLAESVILIIHNNVGGAEGLVLNQPLGSEQIEKLPDELKKIPVSRLFWGGPIDVNKVSVLQFDPIKNHPVRSYLDDIIKNNPEFMNRVIQDQNQPWPKFYVGQAGWAPFQLEIERIKKTWLVGQPDWTFILQTPPDILWQKLNERIKALDRFNSRRLL
jgi:putative transcriptional regulator